MSNYKKIIEERGIPNDIYGSLLPEDAGDEFEQFVWCDKVGGKVYCFGHCTDFYEEEIEKSVRITLRKIEVVRENVIRSIKNI